MCRAICRNEKSKLHETKAQLVFNGADQTEISAIGHERRSNYKKPLSMDGVSEKHQEQS